ncbi:MAG TPA: penicillin-binding transpeptidase domain-containing protein, partial [Pyrinomonadaceae bacterium]
TPGLERALFGVESGVVPESWDVVMGRNLRQKVNTDVRLTIDRDLQKAVVEQLEKSGRKGAVVILNPQTGEVLALYSNPSYSLKEVQDEASWIKLNADKRDNPLISRALGKYYVPGSTFKTMTMTAAFLAGQQDRIFPGTGGGYVAEPGGRPITDDNGSCEACGNVDINSGYQKSSNQYFAQMAVALGPERMQAAAKLLGVGAYNSPSGEGQGRFQPEIWNASTDAVKRAIAPREAWMVTGPKMRKYDLALEGFGQGYAGNMTPFQMALFASTIANMQGRLMKPRIEYDRPPEVFNQVVSVDQAANMRRIMGLVNQPGGTGYSALLPVTSAGISSGGKTGTAQKEIPLYDDKTGEIVTRKKVERDPKGRIIGEREEIVKDDCLEIDAWYLCIAPLENPQIAMAVVVEGKRCETRVYGGKYAAPIAAALVLKARELGLLGNVGNAPANTKNAGRRGGAAQQPTQGQQR